MNTGNKTIVMVGSLLGVLLVIGGIWYFTSGSRTQTPESPPVEESTQNNEVITSETGPGTAEEEEVVVEDDETVKTLAMESQESQSVALTDVSEGTNSGTAYIARVAEEGLYHYVVATLADPVTPEGSDELFYEGWLVKDETTDEFISTGILEKDTEGNYILVFKSDDLMEGYNTVVITLEQTEDETPEEHVLEGTFE